MDHNRMADWPQIYIKEGASQLEQRVWLDFFISNYCQAKKDGTSPVITKHVLNIAQYLMDADEIDVPPPHILTDLLKTQRIPDMSPAIQREFILLLSSYSKTRELCPTTHVQIDESALAQKLRDNVRDKKLTPTIMASMLKYYQAQRSPWYQRDWNAARSRAQHLFFAKIDMSLHEDLKITIDVGSYAELPPVSLHCSLILK